MSSFAEASLLDPIYECKSTENFFTFTLQSKTEGTVQYKESICPIEIVDIDVYQQRAGADGININFNVNDCHKKIFYIKGFFKIESGQNADESISYVLALKGKQTMSCMASKASVRKILKFLQAK
jgi:hypothetical protein